ncbi:hypothetical protein [Vibrio owensii]|uniref:G-D-S-L family lipolytic protein n=1 Tax=Vibrio owensii CAIM 1854 = LMG 25443 TaxID=1229493 RepID=A0A0C1Z9A5_9VIBR|nr:hypothetical protein [Vibrio owensii]KIF52734.1 G-D-S-L family lipolytic protein [Vibrio owensii CAIM 1854 = LMG 25443]
MDHNQALKRVYELTPQLREYDEFMYLGVRWLPYVMFSQLSNYKSDVINTDGLGFRLSLNEVGRFSSIESFDNNNAVNLVIGGSTALGTGTTSDSCTIASVLSQLTGETWLNLGVRGFNAYQEMIQFIMNKKRFSKINHIVIISGLNTLTLEGLPDELRTEYGKYYYSYEFNHYMELYNKDLLKKNLTYGSKSQAEKNNILSSLKNKFNDWINYENPAEKIIEDGHISIVDRVDIAAQQTLEAAITIKQLMSNTDTNVHFTLQPLSRWCKSTFHKEEEDMFEAIDGCANNFWRLFGSLCSTEVHSQYSNILQQGCSDNGIEYSDMNHLLGESQVCRDNIFVDHLHFNDHGYQEVAKLIHENHLSKEYSNVA